MLAVASGPGVPVAEWAGRGGAQMQTVTGRHAAGAEDGAYGGAGSGAAGQLGAAGGADYSCLCDSESYRPDGQW